MLGLISREFISKVLRRQSWIVFNNAKFRDYALELQAIARLLNKIRDIIARKTLTLTKQMNLIFSLQIRFDKLTKQYGVLSGALPA